MHLDYTVHFWPTIGYLASMGAAIRFLVFVCRQMKRAVNAIVDAKNAFVTILHQHYEVYGWYSEYVKPHQKPNGSALGRLNDRT